MNIEKAWKTFLKKVLNDGKKHEKDDGDKVLESMINHAFIPNVQDSLFCHGNNITTDMFLDMIKNGVFNIEGYPIKDEALAGYVKQLDDTTQIFLEEDENGNLPFVYTYPERLYNMNSVDRENNQDHYNQIDVIVNRLKNYPGSNRAVATLYQVGLDKDEQHIPCLNWIQCTIRDNKLILHVIFRSNDLWNAFPSNMLFLNYLGLKIVNELKEVYPSLEFYGISYTSSSLHIYEGDIKQAKKVIGCD